MSGRRAALRDFPVAPLQPIMRARYVDSSDPRTKFRPTADPANGTGVSALARTFHLSGHTARRWMTDGLTFFEADDAAGVFGGTIYDLWPDEVAAADLADEIVGLVLARDRARTRAWVRRYLDTFLSHGSSGGLPLPSTESPLALRMPDAARRAGISRTKLYELASSGKLKTVLVGGCRLVRVADLEEFLAGLEPSVPEPRTRRASATA